MRNALPSPASLGQINSAPIHNNKYTLVNATAIGNSRSVDEREGGARLDSVDWNLRQIEVLPRLMEKCNGNESRVRRCDSISPKVMYNKQETAQIVELIRHRPAPGYVSNERDNC